MAFTMIVLGVLFGCFMQMVAQPVITPNDTTGGYLKQYGIDVDEQFATTEDGYILRMFRLPRIGAPVAILQHGILASSWCWLVNTPEKSLGIALWKMGYDVWLTNSRGNTFSRNHTKYKPFLDVKFWDYTFNDMGEYDVIANVQHVISATQQKTVTFIGWSQGTTQMFIAAQGKHKAYLDDHINLFVALSPVTYMKHQRSELLNVVSIFRLGALMSTVFPFGFLDQEQLPMIAEFFCKNTNGTLCKLTVDEFCGTSQFDNAKAIENLVAHFPAGTSVKDLNHYEQFIVKERFGQYDYGTAGNLKHYLWPTPPDYHLKNLGMKTAFFIGVDDALADPTDVSHAIDDLSGNSNLIFSKLYLRYSHLTWMVGNQTEWIDDAKTLLSHYNPISGTIFQI